MLLKVCEGERTFFLWNWGFEMKNIDVWWYSTDLQSSNGGGLESEISFEVLSDFSHETLEGQLPDEQLSGLLVSSDLPESHSSGPVPVGLLHSSGGGSRFSGSLGGQLLPGGLSSSGLTGGLLGTSHCDSSDDTDGKQRLTASFILRFPLPV